MPKRTHPWLKHYPAGVPAQLPSVRHTLPQLLHQAAHQWPNRPALNFLGASTTYAELCQQAQAVAQALQAGGLRPGARVALCLPNCPAYVAAFFGVLQAGGVVVNLNPLYTQTELTHMLRTSGAQVLIGVALQPIWRKLVRASRGTRVRRLVAVNLATFMPRITALGFRVLKLPHLVWRLPRRAVWWQAWVQAPHAARRPVRRTPRSAAVLQFTGGTTGEPKAAVLTHASLLANSQQIIAWLGQPRPGGESIAAVLPLFHVFALTGILLLGVGTGATIHLLPQFQLKQLLRLIQRQRITLLPGVPALFNAIANSPLTPRYNLRSITYCISGGAPLPKAVKQRFQRLTGARVVEGYGLTEASPVVACGPRVGRIPAGSVGLPLPGTQVRIHQPGGEIWLRGPQLMARYWHNPKATRQVLTGGWLRTGDAGYLNRQGFLFITDRLKDIIFVNGYKVFPRHVEEVLARHPAVAEVAVVATQHPHKGEMPVAYVSLRAHRVVTPAQLRRFAAKHLNPFSLPAHIALLPALPKTLVGKIDKKPLRQQAQALAAQLFQPTKA